MRATGALRTGVAPGGALVGPWAQNELWQRARAVPSLDLRFAENKSLVDATTGQNLVTFTRASSGTYVDSTGTIRTATTNLLVRSEEFDSASWTKTRSSITANAATSPDGTQSADKLVEDTSASNTHIISQGSSFVSGTTYTMTVFAKAAERTFLAIITGSVATPAGGARFNLVNGTASVATGSLLSFAITAFPNGWYRCSITQTATSSASDTWQIRLDTGSSTIYTGDGTSGIYLWGAQLEQSSTVGEYIPTTSTINSAPRFDHNPTTGESLGLLVEEQRTNVVLQSQDFATTWATTSASVSTNTTTAPDGTLTADTITASSSTLGRVQQTITFTGDGDKAISVWLKAGTAPTSVIKIDDSTAGFVNRLLLTVTWTNGVASGLASNGTLQGIDAFPNGWYRIRGLAVGVVAANTNRYRIEADSTNGTGSVIAWGAQAENGAFSTSYIPTTTAAATRSADVPTDTTRGAALRSLFVQFRSPASGTRPIVSLDDNTANERIELFTSGTDPKLLVTDGGSAQADIDAGAITANTTACLAARFNTDNFAASVSGGAEVLDATGTMPTVDRIRIGRDQAGNCLNGTIARITGWNAPLNVLPQVTQ